MDFMWVYEVFSNVVFFLIDYMVDFIYYFSDRNIFIVIFMKYGNVFFFYVNEN